MCLCKFSIIQMKEEEGDLCCAGFPFPNLSGARSTTIICPDTQSVWSGRVTSELSEGFPLVCLVVAGKRNCPSGGIKE